jgi:hypothetical protein
MDDKVDKLTVEVGNLMHGLTWEEKMKILVGVFYCQGAFDTDNDGQLVLYTGEYINE